MILVWMIVILLAGGVLALWLGRFSDAAPRWVALIATTLDLLLALKVWLEPGAPISLAGSGPWLIDLSASWIPELGIRFHLALDGLSLLMLVLTFFLGIVSVTVSWHEIKARVGFFHFNLLWILAGITGVFLALDLFLFYSFWEVMLVPMYFLISIWGHERRLYAAIKFFIFTQASGLLMLLAILALYFIHGRQTGVYTFDYPQLLGTALSTKNAMWLMLGFFIAFAVKIPAVPLHNWLPDAHTEAPTAGSVILAGLLLKTGAYGLLRFVVPLFPQAAHAFAPVAMSLAVVGILYGALLAFAQTDLKRLVAYTSVSHMGFVLLGIFAWNPWALQGAVMQMLCHGLGTGGLFMLVGLLQERTHTRELARLGGLWPSVPRMGGVAMFLTMAALGLPGLGNFIGEFLALLGAYRVSIALTALATLGLVFATVYSLWMMQRVFLGERRNEWKIKDFSAGEMVEMSLVMLGLVWLGLYPQTVLRTAQPALDGLQRSAARPVVVAPPQQVWFGGYALLLRRQARQQLWSAAACRRFSWPRPGSAKVSANQSVNPPSNVIGPTTDDRTDPSVRRIPDRFRGLKLEVELQPTAWGSNRYAVQIPQTKLESALEPLPKVKRDKCSPVRDDSPSAQDFSPGKSAVKMPSPVGTAEFKTGKLLPIAVNSWAERKSSLRDYIQSPTSSGGSIGGAS